MRSLALLGSTGSIGTSTLDVVLAHPERLSVVALAAGRNRDLLKAQCEAFRPRCVSVGTREDAHWLRSVLPYQPDLHWGAEGLLACALHADADTVVAAVVGSAGLASTEAALRAGRRVCVANKESLVVGGALMHEAALAGGGELLPVDSEHAALHQLLADRDPATIREVRITASGGPFRDWPLARIQEATVAQALNHPTWKMGPKITIDSATLMNKGLEVIEASVLFGLHADQVAVTVHPQSQVHAMVGFHDGSYQLQVCANDMKVPIQYCLLYPEKQPGPVAPYAWDGARAWTFEPPDLDRFPCLGLAFEALRAGGTAPALLNAANEVAVAAFLQGRLRFWDIQACNRETLARIPVVPAGSLEEVLGADGAARRHAEGWVQART
ncbi:MAG: 1-deoxy-D-xylulose-5-phosphate reductoisomerase [Geothrix sp.]|uniref:1-deoxy-D-xylulose-5-phosphate reductoisomerase n=1 Tax=Geothrix sp. TaxID=1962974 RepID=UPI001811B9A2|nr:1-deoxy-D-xylulose-5-phosphate reductoisomerase [Geothrix sp.]NWJ41310.1 1-deoxy-D-xylulose-5-phosphate reductoisomerase [Geothrix sp.]WIL20702.1 MAG: 1-deoxy-D-xylulose-5-phosphate reductoisomerase [Geothrix sp.]